MNTKRDTPPSNLRSLQTRIDKRSSGEGSTGAAHHARRRERGRRTDVAIKRRQGRTAMKLRVGEPGSRFTPDFDGSRPAKITLDENIDELADRLADGWSGFTGTVEQEDAATPDGVPCRVRDAAILDPPRLRGTALADGRVRAWSR